MKKAISYRLIAAFAIVAIAVGAAFATCPGLNLSVWTDGTWEYVTFETASKQVDVWADTIPSGVQLEVKINGSWVAASAATVYTTDSARTNGAVTVGYDHQGCSDDLILGDD